jgi:FHA domain
LPPGAAGEPFFAFKDVAERLALFRAGRGGGVLDRRPAARAGPLIAWDDEVSGLHVELQAIGGAWTIADDGRSTNGTFVNEQRIAIALGRRRPAPRRESWRRGRTRRMLPRKLPRAGTRMLMYGSRRTR